MQQFSKLHMSRIKSAIAARHVREISFQLASGFAICTAVGSALGALLGATAYGAFLGFAVHAVLMITSNDRIEELIEERNKAYLQAFLQQIRKAPKIVQQHYRANLDKFNDKQMTRWAVKDFAVRIETNDIIEMLND